MTAESGAAIGCGRRGERFESAAAAAAGGEVRGGRGGAGGGEGGFGPAVTSDTPDSPTPPPLRLEWGGCVRGIGRSSVWARRGAVGERGGCGGAGG